VDGWPRRSSFPGQTPPLRGLLGQRRALREAGLDPEQAELRRTEIVERYEQ